MSRTTSAAAALLVGLIISACADHPAPPPLPAAAARPAAERCGDQAHPCMLEPITVSVAPSRNAD